jgi:hypothetical protein
LTGRKGKGNIPTIKFLPLMKMKKSAKILMAGLVLFAFLLVPFLHGTHAFHNNESANCYICKFVKTFTFSLAIFTPFIFALNFLITLCNENISPSELLSTTALLSRGPPPATAHYQ